MNGPSPTTPRSRWWTFLFLGILLLCVVGYFPALSGQWVFDDYPLLVRNDCWRGLDKIPAMFGLGEPTMCNYRPGRYLSFALDYAIAGMNPLVFHISSLIYHLVTVGCVFLIFRRWASVGAALLMVGIWALHPVHADTVAYISGRRDVFSTLLFVAAFLQLMPPQGKKLRIWRIVAGIALYALAIRTKEMAVTLPAVLLWVAIAKNVGQTGKLVAHLKRRWPLYVVLLLGAAAFVVYRGFLHAATRIEDGWWGGSPVTNFATVFKLYVHYMGIILWPATLAGDYFPVTIPLAQNFAEPMALAGMAIYGGFLVLIVVALKRGWNATAIGLGWFLITMLPVSHIIPHHELFAEHYLYLPMIGLLVSLLPLAEWVLSRKPLVRKVFVSFMCLVMVALTIRTGFRSTDYQTNRGFYEAAHAAAPNNARILYNLGLSYLADDNCEEAVPLMLGAARYLRRQSALSQGNVAAFLNCAERLGRPDIVDALVGALLERYSAEPLGHAWQGRRFLEAGRAEEAVVALSRAVVLEHGNDADAVAMLGMAHNEIEQYEEALEVLHSIPHEHQGHCEQEVRALMGLGVEHYSDAFYRVEDCLETWPDSLLLLEFRAGLYFSLGQRDQAEADLARLEELGASEETLERVRAWRICGRFGGEARCSRLDK